MTPPSSQQSPPPGGSPGPSVPGPTTSIEPLLAHAERCWRAEEENARRLATKRSVLLSGTAAAFALTIAKLIDMAWPAKDHGKPSWVMAALLLAGVLWILRILHLVLLPAPTNRIRGDLTFASSYLPTSRKLVRSPWRLTSLTAQAEALWNLEEAATRLHLRNEEEERRLRSAEEHIWAGFTVGAVGLGLYCVWACSGLKALLFP